jgi:hypothetical protein
MPTSDEYRATAEECYRLAQEAKSEADRLACLDLASTWLDAASRRDEMTPEEVAEAEKLAQQKTTQEARPAKSLSGWRRLYGFFVSSNYHGIDGNREG